MRLARSTASDPTWVRSWLTACALSASICWWACSAMRRASAWACSRISAMIAAPCSRASSRSRAASCRASASCSRYCASVSFASSSAVLARSMPPSMASRRSA